MSIHVLIDNEVRRLGHEYGRDLAAALVLASDAPDVDRTMKQELAQIVLDQIEAMVARLEDAPDTAGVAQIYERAARKGVRDTLRERIEPLRLAA